MSSDAEHVHAANRFQATLDILLVDPATNGEVIAITAYYKAMHVIEALFYHDPQIGHCYSHHDRLDHLINRRSFQGLYRPAKILWGASEVARYLVSRGHDSTGKSPGPPRKYGEFTDYMVPAKIRGVLLDPNLASIEKQAVRMRPATFSSLVLYTSAPALPTSTPGPSTPPSPGSPPAETP